VRVVIASPTLPLPFLTADARWLHVLVTGLANRGLKVTCVSCTDSPPRVVSAAVSAAEAANVRFVHVPLVLSDSTVVHRKAASLRRPFSEYARVSGFQAAVRSALASDCDVLHVEGLFTSWPFLGQSRLVTYAHHFDVVDWAGRPAMSARDRVTYLQMRRATRRLLPQIPRMIVGSTRLAKEARHLGFAADLDVSPLGLDLDLYQPVVPSKALTVGVIGSMHWYPSRSAAERVLKELWPEIHRRVPDSRLLVAGWNAERFLGHLFPVPGAELLGEVPDPASFFSRCSVILYPPSRGSGMKIKVLEAMAYGIPVVSNREGLEGLEPLPADGPIQAEQDEELISATVSVLTNTTQASRMCESGIRLMHERFSSSVVDRLLESYQRLRLTA
jgi:polysaccharide biosynthesis protein PslH